MSEEDRVVKALLTLTRALNEFKVQVESRLKEIEDKMIYTSPYSNGTAPISVDFNQDELRATAGKKWRPVTLPKATGYGSNYFVQSELSAEAMGTLDKLREEYMRSLEGDPWGPSLKMGEPFDSKPQS